MRTFAAIVILILACGIIVGFLAAWGALILAPIPTPIIVIGSMFIMAAVAAVILGAIHTLKEKV